jgi:hypothetical protein
MTISNQHNLVDPPAEVDGQFGIRVTIKDSDPFQRLLPNQWETFHWFPNAAERDRAVIEMSHRHRFSRIGDEPTLNYEPIER